MFQLLQTVLLAATVALSGPVAQSTCTVVQTDATHYEATVAWSGFAVTSMEIFQGSTVLAQSQLSKSRRKGSLTLQFSTQPTDAVLSGPNGRLHASCNLAG